MVPIGVISALLLLITASDGYLVKDGNCSLASSSIPVIENFDLQKYLGKWFEIERYEQDFQRNLECVTVDFSQSKSDESLDVKNKGYAIDKDTYVSFDGVATLSDPKADLTVGKLNMSYGIKAEGILNYWIVDTDYTNFAVVYSCAPIEGTESVIEGYWLLSRTAKLIEEAQLAEKLKYLQVTYFVPSHVRVTNHSETLCRKEPEIPVTPSALILPPLN